MKSMTMLHGHRQPQQKHSNSVIFSLVPSQLHMPLSCAAHAREGIIIIMIIIIIIITIIISIVKAYI